MIDKDNGEGGVEDKTLDELMAKITHPKKLLFLEQYPKFNYIMKTSDAVGVDRATVWRWIDSDKVFSHAMQLIKKDIERNLIATHEANIDNVCLNEKTPAQSRIFGSLVKLRALSPERYRENQPIKPEREVIYSLTFIMPDGRQLKAKELAGQFKELKEGTDVKGTSQEGLPARPDEA